MADIVRGRRRAPSRSSSAFARRRGRWRPRSAASAFHRRPGCGSRPARASGRRHASPHSRPAAGPGSSEPAAWQASSAQSIVDASRSPKRTLSMSRYSSVKASSSSSGMSSDGLAFERGAQEGGELLGHRLRILVAAGDDQRGDRVQRIEQEMRIELVAQRGELGLLRGDVGLGELAFLLDSRRGGHN